MDTKTLTLDQLVLLRACEEQRLKFKAIFGDAAEVSVERFSQPDVAEARFDYDWAAEAFLTEEERKLYYVERRKRRDALMKQHQVSWYSDIPEEARWKLDPTLWAEVYVKSTGTTLPAEEPKVEGTISETPVEESFGGY